MPQRGGGKLPAGADAGLHVPGDGAADGADAAEAKGAPREGVERPVPGRRMEGGRLPFRESLRARRPDDG
jgi:hypothetical protein